MSYFLDFITAIGKKLPLLIEEIEWDGTTFHMRGNNWNFNAMADWVVVDNFSMIIGCHDDAIEDYLKKNILGKSITNIQPSSDVPSYDPIFELSNDIKIRIFSTSFFEPWKFIFRDEYIFIASPSDRQWGATAANP